MNCIFLYVVPESPKMPQGGKFRLVMNPSIKQMSSSYIRCKKGGIFVIFSHIAAQKCFQKPVDKMLKNVSRIYQAVGAVNDYLEGEGKILSGCS